MAIDRYFDIPFPLNDVQARWREIQASRAAKVRFSAVDELHTRVHVSADDDGAVEVEEIMGELRALGLGAGEAGRQSG